MTLYVRELIVAAQPEGPRQSFSQEKNCFASLASDRNTAWFSNPEFTLTYYELYSELH